MLLPIKVATLLINQPVQRPIRRRISTCGKEVQHNHILEFHPFALENRQDQHLRAHSSVDLLLHVFIPDQNNLICTKIGQLVVQVNQAERLVHQDVFSLEAGYIEELEIMLSRTEAQTIVVSHTENGGFWPRIFPNFWLEFVNHVRKSCHHCK